MPTAMTAALSRIGNWSRAVAPGRLGPAWEPPFDRRQRQRLHDHAEVAQDVAEGVATGAVVQVIRGLVITGA